MIEESALTDEAIEAIQMRLLAWGDAHYRLFPWRAATDPFAGLIAEVLLQRTRADAVPEVYDAFIRRFPDAAALSVASEQEIGALIYPLGLRWRVPLLKELGQRLLELGEIPRELDALQALPGVGPYTAAAWLSFHGGGRGVLIDSNVVRWLCRMLDRQCDAETRRKRWLQELAEHVTPRGMVKQFNYALLDFTMTVCIPRVPRCKECPIGPGLCLTGQRLVQQAPVDIKR
jgi:A/G-specific adenine glycosylase